MAKKVVTVSGKAPVKGSTSETLPLSGGTSVGDMLSRIKLPKKKSRALAKRNLKVSIVRSQSPAFTDPVASATASSASSSMSEDSGGDERLRYGAASLRGRRPTNEDELVVLPDVGVKKKKVGLFAVFDGHGGSKVSALLKKKLPGMVRDRVAKDTSQPGLKKALEGVFRDIDKKIMKRKLDGGSTAVVALLTDRHLVVGSVGDSRCLVYQDGRSKHLTHDHAISDSEEAERIRRAGVQPYVDDHKVTRIGGLNMSRSLGDLDLKDNSLSQSQQAVSAVPRVRSIVIKPGIEFMVLSCDGVFEVMSNNGVMVFVRDQLKNQSPRQAVKALVKHAYHKGSTDNMSAIIVDFHRNAFSEQWTKLKQTSQPAAISAARSSSSSSSSERGSTSSSRSRGRSRSRRSSSSQHRSRDLSAHHSRSRRSSPHRHHTSHHGDSHSHGHHSDNDDDDSSSYSHAHHSSHIGGSHRHHSDHGGSHHHRHHDSHRSSRRHHGASHRSADGSDYSSN